MDDTRNDSPSDSHLSPEDVFESDVPVVERSSVIDARHAEPFAPPVADLQVEAQATVPGPGFLEACLWWVGFLATHAIAAIGLIIVFAIVTLLNSKVDFGDRGAVEALINKSLKEPSIGPILGEMLIFVVVAVGASFLRIGSNPFRKLGSASISAQHLVLIVGGAFPLMIFCGSVHHHLNGAWHALMEQMPFFKKFDTSNINAFMGTLKDVPVPLLLLAIAVCPAIGEEIVFRGVIGRGLVARYGIVVGVLLTSCFFAFAHIHPAHSLAVLPLGIYLHIAYLATRSWVAPVLIHFINNAAAVVMMQVADRLQGNKLADDAAQPGWMLALTGVISFGTMVALWKSRVEYRDDDGKNWDPGYPTVEQPPLRAAATPVMRPANPFLFGSAMSAGCLLTGLFLIGIAGAFAQDIAPIEQTEVISNPPAATEDEQ